MSDERYRYIAAVGKQAAVAGAGDPTLEQVVGWMLELLRHERRLLPLGWHAEEDWGVRQPDGTIRLSQANTAGGAMRAASRQQAGATDPDEIRPYRRLRLYLDGDTRNGTTPWKPMALSKHLGGVCPSCGRYGQCGQPCLPKGWN